eukprot:TRINITY_DN2895_c0_g1_i1.p1 TRINITY_DN2895_c0_g1~~TRINITY_DN2895_c0_g1_i1.p1  ORF type:complete len:159 (+),score=11.50 TRINITY_DN2895_c0_g1_i1:384-860(+)
MSVARNGWDPAVTMLVAYGASVDVKSTDGDTALICACLHNRTSTVAILLAAGADTALANADGKDCLTVADENGHFEVVAQIVAHRQQVERVRVTEVGLGLAAMDLPVLVVWRLYQEAIVFNDQSVPRPEAWEILKAIKESAPEWRRKMGATRSLTLGD